MKYQQLNEGQRYKISVLLADNLSCREISICIGVSKSTVSRELKRNCSDTGYEPLRRRSRSAVRGGSSQPKRRLIRRRLTTLHVLLHGSGVLRKSVLLVVLLGAYRRHEWIYQYIYADKRNGGELYKHLRRGKRRYRKGYGQKRGRIPDAVSIELCPSVIDERSRLGDWEAALVLGKQGTGAIVTLAERKSRIYLTKKVLSKEASKVSNAIISLLSEFKDVVHTITFDNGLEFSEHQKIAEAVEAEMYFAHPYSSHKRGLNENTNSLLRQFVPKGTDLRTVSEEDLQRYLSWRAEQQATQVSWMQATLAGICGAKTGG